MFIMFNMHVGVCLCMCVHACMNVHSAWGIPTPAPPQSAHPPPPRGRTPVISKNSITLELIRIISLFEDLKSVETLLPMGGCMVWWMDGWVDGWGQVKSLKMLKMLT